MDTSPNKTLPSVTSNTTTDDVSTNKTSATDPVIDDSAAIRAALEQFAGAVEGLMYGPSALDDHLAAFVGCDTSDCKGIKQTSLALTPLFDEEQASSLCAFYEGESEAISSSSPLCNMI